MFQSHNFGERLRKFRERKGFTQEILGRKIGIGHGSIWQWENGKSLPRADYLFDMCQVLSVSADELLGLFTPENSEVETGSGLKWRIIRTRESEYVASLEIHLGVDLFRKVVKDHKDLIEIQSIDPFRSGEKRLRDLLNVAFLSSSIEIVGVERDLIREEKLVEKYAPSLRQCIVANLDLPFDSAISSTIRTEAVAWLAAKEAIKVLPNAGLVGLTGGTTISRFVDLILPASPRFGGIRWVPLLTAKMTTTAVSSSANNVIGRMVYNQPGSEGFRLPFVKVAHRNREYMIHAPADEQQELELAWQVLEDARNASDAFISVGSPEFNFRTNEAHLGMPGLMKIYEGLIITEQRRCVGDILLYLVDGDGKRLGNTEVQAANDALVYSIGLDGLAQIAAHGTVWILAGRASKAPVIRSALKSNLANCIVIDGITADALLDL